MIIIFLGPPGAGKGTQAQLLAQKLNLPVISMGQLLRKAYNRGTPEGREWWENYGRRGLNAPMKLKSKILTEVLNRATTGFILEGFPKTQEDLAALQKYLGERAQKIDRVFHLLISENAAFKRILARKEKGEEVRDDDNFEILKTRFEAGYRRDLPQILDYFRRLKVLEELDAESDKETIRREILSKLGIND